VLQCWPGQTEGINKQVGLSGGGFDWGEGMLQGGPGHS